MQALHAGAIAALLCLTQATASAQLVVGYSSGETYVQSQRTGSVTPLAPFATFQVYAAAADEATRTLWVIGPGSSPPSASLWRWNYDGQTPLVEVGPIQHPLGLTTRWDGLAIANGTFYAVLQFAPLGAPAGQVGLYELDPTTMMTTQVLAWGGVSIGGIEYNPADGLFYCPDDVARKIVTVDLNAMLITPVPGSDYPAGHVDLDALTIGDGRVYMVDDDANAPVLVFNLATGLYEANVNVSTTVAAGTCGAAWAPSLVDLVGARYCTPATPNSTGAAATIEARGNLLAASNDLDLKALDLPQNSFGYFLTSRTTGALVGAGGSQGTLCLGGNIGRYVGSGQIQNSGAAGSFGLVLDLTQTPTPTGLVPVAAGETWHFTAWFRDSVSGTSTSNFTDAVSLTLQ
ncbi:MAG: hypothetical protein R3F49_10385 [Planctomycetota bacterium]